MLQHAATHCNLQQQRGDEVMQEMQGAKHTATHCNTLQHAAT